MTVCVHDFDWNFLKVEDDYAPWGSGYYRVPSGLAPYDVVEGGDAIHDEICRDICRERGLDPELHCQDDDIYQEGEDRFWELYEEALEEASGY